MLVFKDINGNRIDPLKHTLQKMDNYPFVEIHIGSDSHYNLAPDPAQGAPLVSGITMPTDRPGHGALLKNEKDVTSE